MNQSENYVFLLGLDYFKKQDYWNSFYYFNRCIHFNSSKFNYYIYKSQSLFYLKRFKECKELLNEMILKFPNQYQSYELRGIINMKLLLYGYAEDDFIHVLVLKKENIFAKEQLEKIQEIYKEMKYFSIRNIQNFKNLNHFNFFKSNI